MPGPASLAFSQTAILFLRTTSHFVLTFLPALVLSVFLARRGIRDHILLGLAGLVGIGASGYLVFWLWFLSPRLGHAVSFLLPLFEIAWLLWATRKLDALARCALKSLMFPAALVFAASLMVLAAGFLYGGVDTPLATPWTRFSHPLPPDNILPFVFAEEVRVGRISKPFFEDWTSSDRPPLQAGIALSQYPFLPRPRALGYTAVGVILQSLWIYAMWLMLDAFDAKPTAVVLTLAVTLFSGFTFLNSFFVWPKLLAAAFMTGFCTVVLVDRLAIELRRSFLLAIGMGALLSFGMLAHGGSAFALIGALITAAVLRRRLPFKSLGIIGAVTFALYLPWLLYQKLYDPPGDRLLKLHLAGVDKPDKRTLTQALGDAYSRLTFDAFIKNKEANAIWVFDHEHEYWSHMAGLLSASLHPGAMNSARAAGAALGLRSLMFFHFVPNMGFLIAGVAALLAGLIRRFRSHTWRVSARLWIFVICTLIVWCLLMYEPNATSIHQGTYLTVLLTFSASMLALWAVKPWLALTAAAMQAGLNFLVYGVYMRGRAEAALHSFHYGNLCLFVLAFAFMMFLMGSQWLRQGQQDS